MEIIIGRKGTQKTPINDLTVSREHCKVIANGDGTFTIENLSQFGTKVDGIQIIRAKATLNSRIQLGQSFSALLVELIGVPSAAGSTSGQSASMPNRTPQPTPTKEERTFNITHLRRVWDNYNSTNIEMANQQRKIGLVRGGGMIFTVGGGVLVGITALPEIGYICSGIGVLTMLYSFFGMKNAETGEEKQQRQEAFEDEWVCPNPECRKSLPAKNYKLLVRNYKECPFCHCKFVEK